MRRVLFCCQHSLNRAVRTKMEKAVVKWLAQYAVGAFSRIGQSPKIWKLVVEGTGGKAVQVIRGVQCVVAGHGAVADEEIPVLFRALTGIPGGVHLIICSIHLYDIPGVGAACRPACIVAVYTKGAAQLFEQEGVIKADTLFVGQGKIDFCRVRNPIRIVDTIHSAQRSHIMVVLDVGCYILSKSQIPCRSHGRRW